MFRIALLNLRAICLCAGSWSALVAMALCAGAAEQYEEMPDGTIVVADDEPAEAYIVSSDALPEEEYAEIEQQQFTSPGQFIDEEVLEPGPETLGFGPDEYQGPPIELRPAGEMLDPMYGPDMPYVMQPGGAYQPNTFRPSLVNPKPPTYCPCMTRLGFRHSYTHGRSVGWGQPMVGSSWMNRPFYYGASLGPMWLTNRVTDSVGRDADVMGSLFFGWDWDYYWGSEFQYAYATPELTHSAYANGPIGHRLVSWNYSLMYYPWGDAAIRPYWRFGVGDSKFDFPTHEGLRRDEWLFTTPFGVGMKYPVRRWLATRVEFVDQFSWGGHGAATQHNLVLSFALECHFGGHRKNYWPWNPSYKVW